MICVIDMGVTITAKITGGSDKRKVIDVEELISKIYDPRVVHMDENGRVKREAVIMVINGQIGRAHV